MGFLDNLSKTISQGVDRAMRGFGAGANSKPFVKEPCARMQRIPDQQRRERRRKQGW